MQKHGNLLASFRASISRYIQMVFKITDFGHWSFVALIRRVGSAYF